MSPTSLIDARKAMWTGTRVQLHIECRRLATKAIVGRWMSATYGETARPLRSNYIHSYWLENRDASTIRTYVNILMEGIS